MRTRPSHSLALLTFISYTKNKAMKDKPDPIRIKASVPKAAGLMGL
jgi:hypothetical protein